MPMSKQQNYAVVIVVVGIIIITTVIHDCRLLVGIAVILNVQQLCMQEVCVCVCAIEYCSRFRTVNHHREY